MSPTTRQLSTSTRAATTASGYCLCQHAEDWDDMVECSGSSEECPGNKWYHFTCVGITSQPRGRYLCPSCIQPQQPQQPQPPAITQPTELPMELGSDDDDDDDDQDSGADSDTGTAASIASNLVAAEKQRLEDTQQLEEGVFMVEAIIGHRVLEGGRREFLVKWMSYPEEEATYEDESELARCSHMVAEYCHAHPDLEPTKLSMRGGKSASPRDNTTPQQNGYNYENWVEVDQVLKQINQYTGLKSYTLNNLTLTGTHLLSQLIQETPLQQQAQDSLTVLLHREHYYVLLVSSSSRIVYSCDASNQDHSIHLEPLALACSQSSFQLKQLQFEACGSLGVDHCGSAAASIALEFIRLHSTASLHFSASIRPSKTILAYIIKRLHKMPSEPINKRRPVKSWQPLVCEKCLGFKTWKRVALVNHQRKCLATA